MSFQTRSLLVAASLAAGGVLYAYDTLASEQEPWQFGASIYGWFPDISGQTAFTPPGGGGDFEIGIDQILDNLKFTFQGTFDMRKGRTGFLADVVYMDVGNSKSGVRDGTIGGTPIPITANADVDLDLKSWIWTVAGYYRTYDQPVTTLDMLAGLRYTDVEQKASWNITGSINTSGTAEAGLENWDVIVGMRGNHSFGANNAWFVPYYLDVGTGDSDSTWQAIVGLGYKFRWGETVAFWRYLEYDFDSNSAIADINFSGPAIGVTFRW